MKYSTDIIVGVHPERDITGGDDEDTKDDQYHILSVLVMMG